MKLRNISRIRLTFSIAIFFIAITLGGVAWAQVSATDYPGQPQDGDILWGAALDGQDPVIRHEEPTGATLELHRTFFQWRHRTGYMINTASADIEAGRFPWVSIKTPSWADMATGLHDDEIDEMLLALDALPAPIWLTIHHEPEGGGGVNAPDDPAGAAGHVAMNIRVRERMTALETDNIALAPILMSWTWNPASGRNPNDWWVPGVYDFIGIDHYNTKEASLLTPVWSDIRQWAQTQDVDIAVGEWGMQGSDEAAGQRVHEWHTAAVNSYNDGEGARIVALSVFDSPSTWTNGVWLLEGAQLTAFHDIMALEATSATTTTTIPATTTTTTPTTTTTSSTIPTNISTGPSTTITTTTTVNAPQVSPPATTTTTLTTAAEPKSVKPWWNQYRGYNICKIAFKWGFSFFC